MRFEGRTRRGRREDLEGNSIDEDFTSAARGCRSDNGAGGVGVRLRQQQAATVDVEDRIRDLGNLRHQQPRLGTTVVVGGTGTAQ